MDLEYDKKFWVKCFCCFRKLIQTSAFFLNFSQLFFFTLGACKNNPQMCFSFTCQVSMSAGTPIFVLVCESGPSPIQFTWYAGACLDNTLLVYLWSVNEYSSNSWNSVACIITWKDLTERNISEREIKDASAHIFFFS